MTIARPAVALLTDFGTADHYVGVMKGVILGICPDAALVDITHEVPPQDVLAGALELAAAYPYFPAGTVFVVVVDPGVGSGRRGIAVSAGDHRFVAPDNGVLTPVLRTAGAEVVHLTQSRYARPAVSRTFEGRDRLGPAGAWLAAGVALTALGPRVTDPICIELPQPRVEGGQLTGTVVRVDRFGNLITNIDRAVVERFRSGDAIQVDVAGTEPLPLVGTYAEAPAGGLCALFGSTDHLEIACRGGSAAARLSLRRGAAVCVRAGRPA